MMSFDCSDRPAGASFFCTVSLADPVQFSLCERVNVLSAALSMTQKAQFFHMDAWVVLPNHLHCVWTLRGDESAAVARWQNIKRRFSMGLPTHERSTGPVWRRGMRVRAVSDMLDYATAIRRCWFDPVRHGLVSEPEAWAFSSVHTDDEAVQLVA